MHFVIYFALAVVGGWAIMEMDYAVKQMYGELHQELPQENFFLLDWRLKSFVSIWRAHHAIFAGSRARRDYLFGWATSVLSLLGMIVLFHNWN